MNWFVTTPAKTAVPRSAIPVLSYTLFYEEMCALLAREECHCANYFGAMNDAGLELFALVLNDATGEIYITSHHYAYYREEALPSLTARFPAMHPFEREITENFGVLFEDNPWLKPLRFAHNRAQGQLNHNNYPFYAMHGADLHEVNVGPIHAGIIEPGVFRFICNGEQVLHLEIVLGYQHRGTESLLTATDNRLRHCLLAESIAGDSAASHAVAYCRLIEALGGRSVSSSLDTERVLAIELERVAMHLADTAALCTDIAYQLGKVACEALRTVVINSTQLWCGNRFAKGLIRPAGTYYPLTDALREQLHQNMEEVERRYAEVVDNLLATPSVLARFDECGVVTVAQAQRIGAVGMAARSSGLNRDLRASHPWGGYAELNHQPIVLPEGDVQARLRVRMKEVAQSIGYIKMLPDPQKTIPSALTAPATPDYNFPLAVDSLSFSLVEGWRGELCHVALTDHAGRLTHYKIKDPSLHNWLALALSVRGGAISDFPICNKSFNLSYCGHDL